MKKVFPLLFFLAISFASSAQLARVVTLSGGFSFLTDGAVSCSNLKENPDGISYESYQYYQWNFVTGIFSARVLLIPMTQNTSFSASAATNVSIGAIYPVHDLGSRYGLNVTVPMYLEFNYGAAARYISKSNWGFVLGAGVEYIASPLCSYAVAVTECDNSDFLKTSFLPSCKVGFRYWSKKNHVNEVILRLGIGEKLDKFYTFDAKLSEQYRPMHIGLSFMRVLNY